jgi:hypothetical protein
MSEIADALTANSMLLCNESFSAAWSSVASSPAAPN